MTKVVPFIHDPSRQTEHLIPTDWSDILTARSMASPVGHDLHLSCATCTIAVCYLSLHTHMTRLLTIIILPAPLLFQM